MTLHDDADLELLERELTALAQERVEDERLRLAVRAQLAAQVRPRPRPRPQARWRPSTRIAIGATAAAATAAVVALVVLAGTTGSGGPAAADAAIVRHALAAVTPPANEILHERVVGVQNGVSVAAEVWQETSAPYGSRGIKGAAGHQGEFGDNGTTSFEYDPSTNTIYEQHDSSPPTFTDPISLIRQDLSDNKAQGVGTVAIAGLSLYKIDLPGGLIAYVDPSSYRPRYLDDPQRGGGVVRLRVATLEYLPMTPSNRALLSVTAQHPTARVDTNPSDAPGK
jgi:hypothetical protein